MQFITLFYLVVQYSCLFYAVAWGGRDERTASLAFFAAVVLTTIIVGGIGPHPSHFQTVETSIFVVDLLLFLALQAIAIRSERFWPIWLAAMHGVSVVSHAVKLGEPGLLSQAYILAIGLWGIPMWLLLAWATTQSRRRRATNR